MESRAADAPGGGSMIAAEKTNDPIWVADMVEPIIAAPQGLQGVASFDQDFDKLPVRRIEP